MQKFPYKTALSALALGVFFCVLFFPLYILLKISLSTPAEIFQPRPPYLITQFTGKHFADVLASGAAFYGPLVKSIVVGVGATVFSLAVALPASFAISRLSLGGRYLFLMLLFLSRMLPEVSIALPVAATFIKMGLLDTAGGLILGHMIKILPVVCFILVNVFAQFPRELVDQAMTDGCSLLGAFGRIVMPLSSTGIAVAGMFGFLLSWDEFIYASYLTLAEPTMPLKMYYYVARGNIFASATYAVVIMLPVVVLTVLLQRHIKSSYLSSGIQG